MHPFRPHSGGGGAQGCVCPKADSAGLMLGWRSEDLRLLCSTSPVSVEPSPRAFDCGLASSLKTSSVGDALVFGFTRKSVYTGSSSMLTQTSPSVTSFFESPSTLKTYNYSMLTQTSPSVTSFFESPSTLKTYNYSRPAPEKLQN